MEKLQKTPTPIWRNHLLFLPRELDVSRRRGECVCPQNRTREGSSPNSISSRKLLCSLPACSGCLEPPNTVKAGSALIPATAGRSLGLIDCLRLADDSQAERGLGALWSQWKGVCVRRWKLIPGRGTGLAVIVCRTATVKTHSPRFTNRWV